MNLAEFGSAKLVRSRLLVAALLMVISPAWGAECGVMMARTKAKLSAYRAERDRFADLQASKDLLNYCSKMKRLLGISQDASELLTEAQACPGGHFEETPDAIETEVVRLIGGGLAKCLALAPEGR